MERDKVFSGKTAIVTGASSGIGRAMALTLAKAGAAVVIHARRKDRLEKLPGEIAAQGGKALAVEARKWLVANGLIKIERSGKESPHFG